MSLEDAFLEWCNASNIYLHPSISLFHNFPTTGRGVLAKSKLDLGEVLCVLPENTYLSPQMYKGSKSLSPFATLMAVFMHELSRGPNSNFFLYLKSLPKKYDTALNFSPEERAELLGTAIYNLVENPSLNLEAVGKPALEEIQSENPNFFVDFQWVYDSITTRAFNPNVPSENGNNGPFLLPVIDLFNHRSERYHVEIKKEGNVFKLVTIDYIEKGDEIFTHYGKLSSGQTLLTFGFIDSENNPYDSVDLPVSMITSTIWNFSNKETPDFSTPEPDATVVDKEDDEMEDDVSVWKAKREYLKIQNLPLPGVDRIILTKEALLPNELMDIVKVLLMDEAEFDQLVENNKKVDEVDLGEEGECLVFEGIVNIIDRRLQLYTTDYLKDRELLKDKKIPFRRRMSILLRLREKGLLIDLRNQLRSEIIEIMGDQKVSEKGKGKMQDKDKGKGKKDKNPQKDSKPQVETTLNIEGTSSSSSSSSNNNNKKNNINNNNNNNNTQKDKGKRPPPIYQPKMIVEEPLPSKKSKK